MISGCSIRERLFLYVSPYIKLFPTTYALVFGTRHGVSQFADDIHKLYREGYFRKLIISGGTTVGSSCSEAGVMSQELMLRGMPKAIMVLEGKAKNTEENVKFSRAEVKDPDIREIMLIGKMSSARRYIMTVRRQWPEIKHICCHRVNYFGCEEQFWWKNREFRQRVIGECRKIRSYLEKGHIAEIEIVDGVVI